MKLVKNTLIFKPFDLCAVHRHYHLINVHKNIPSSKIHELFNRVRTPEKFCKFVSPGRQEITLPES